MTGSRVSFEHHTWLLKDCDPATPHNSLIIRCSLGQKKIYFITSSIILPLILLSLRKHVTFSVSIHKVILYDLLLPTWSFIFLQVCGHMNTAQGERWKGCFRWSLYPVFNFHALNYTDAQNILCILWQNIRSHVPYLHTFTYNKKYNKNPFFIVWLLLGDKGLPTEFVKIGDLTIMTPTIFSVNCLFSCANRCPICKSNLNISTIILW